MISINYFIIIWFLFICVLIIPFIILSDSKFQQSSLSFWIVVGISASLFKFFILSLHPQWSNFPPDSLTYANQDEFLYHIWKGDSGSLYSTQPYAKILKTYEWIYPALVGLHHYLGDYWKLWALATNLIFAGFFPAITWLFATHLKISDRSKIISTLLITIDPTTAVNASWLLKDSFATYLGTLAVLTCMYTLKRGNYSYYCLLTLLMMMLALTRFSGYLAILIAFVFIMLIQGRFIWNRRQCLIIGLLSSLLLFGYSIEFPSQAKIYQPTTISKKLLTRLAGPAVVLTEQDNVGHFDIKVSEWQQYFRANPILGLIRAIVRTLFAPYPWAILKQPITWTDNNSELYYYGSFLWLIFIPFIINGFIFIIKRNKPSHLFLFFVIAILTSEYIISYGEWSTRQRAFMNPVFFAIAGLGFDFAYHWLWNNRIKKRFLMPVPLAKPQIHI